MPVGEAIRSLLFVPGDSESKALKALGGAADAVILDLEDAVAPGAKVEARACTRRILDSVERHDKAVFVRINAFDTGLAVEDLAAVIGGKPWGIVLPKCNGAHDLQKLSTQLDKLELEQGLANGAIRALAICTETAAGTLNLGASHHAVAPRLWGTLWGGEDLAASLGSQHNRDESGAYTFPYQFARSQSLYAAAAAGAVAIDAVCPDFRDLEGLEKEAREGLRDGFAAKAAIHPAQVEVINRVFTPDPARVQWAEQVIVLLAATAVAKLDGRMIDLAHKRIAERILQRARALSSRPQASASSR